MTDKQVPVKPPHPRVVTTLPVRKRRRRRLANATMDKVPLSLLRIRAQPPTACRRREVAEVPLKGGGLNA